jgi:hypothetical protein
MIKLTFKSGKEIELELLDFEELKSIFGTPTYTYLVQPYCPPCNSFPVFTNYPVWPYGKYEITCGTAGSQTHSNGTLS